MCNAIFEVEKLSEREEKSAIVVMFENLNTSQQALSLIKRYRNVQTIQFTIHACQLMILLKFTLLGAIAFTYLFCASIRLSELKICNLLQFCV